MDTRDNASAARGEIFNSRCSQKPRPHDVYGYKYSLYKLYYYPQLYREATTLLTK